MIDINPSDLSQPYIKKNELILQSYEIIFEQCWQKMKVHSNSGYFGCFFTIPKRLAGSYFPPINVDLCKEFIYEKFDEMNKSNPVIISAKEISSDVILIGWAPIV